MCGGIKVGDQVICIDNGASADLASGVLKLNEVYTVTAVFNSSLIGVNGVIQRVSRGRFKVLEEEVFDHKSTHNFKVGDRVRCINTADTVCLKKGCIYTIKKVLVGGALILELNNSQYNHSLFELVENKPVVKVGSIVECVNNSVGKIKIGQKYIVSRLVTSNGSHIEVEGIEGETFGIVRFKLVDSKKPEHDSSKTDMYKMMIAGSVVECVNDQGFVLGEGLVKGQRYKVLEDKGSKLVLEGKCNYILVKSRFKIVPTNELKSDNREELYKKLEEFRGVSTFNEIIVNEGIFYCEAENTWKSHKEESLRWVYFIKGSWLMFCMNK